MTGTLKKKKRKLRYGNFCGFSGAKIVILSPIDFQCCLPINLNANAQQYKFEVDILKNMAKIANSSPKIGQIPLLSLAINGHNSIIFHPILTFFILNCLLVRDESNGVKIKAISFGFDFSVWPHFCPQASHG